jgi:hypothetical protein
MTPLLADEEPHTGRCRRCRRPLTDPASVGYRIGPDCRAALGIASRSPVRLTRVRPSGDVPGQTDLLDEQGDNS